LKNTETSINDQLEMSDVVTRSVVTTVKTATHALDHMLVDKEQKEDLMSGSLDNSFFENQSGSTFDEQMSSKLKVDSSKVGNHKVGVLAVAILECSVSPSRASPRLAGMMEEHSMSWAERRTAMKNLEFNVGNNNSFCLFSKPLEDSIMNIKQLGVSFGDSNEALVVAVNLFV
jgi:hypothetical protein